LSIDPGPASPSLQSGSRLGREFAALMCLLLISALLTWIGVAARGGSSFSLLWPANAALVGILLRYYPRAGLVHLLVALLGLLLVDACYGTPLRKSLLLNGANILTVAIAWLSLRRQGWGPEGLISATAIPRLMLHCQPAILAGALCGGAAVVWLGSSTGWKSTIMWYLAELINFSVLLPSLLTLPGSWRQCRQEMWRDRRYLVPALLFLLLILLLDKHLGGPGLLVLPVPALIWLALSGNRFFTCLATCAASLYMFTVLDDQLLHQWSKDAATVYSFRTGISILALSAITTACAVAERDQLFARLQQVASHDHLTGVLNRGAFSEATEQRLEREGGALLLLDVDFFKKINDEHGHPTGDTVLVQLCQRLEGLLPPRALLGRMGGEEFAVLLPPGEESELAEQADRLIQGVADRPLVQAMRVTISGGLRQASPGESLSELLADADLALYRAKQTGRNRWCRAT
jgi:diguanylate cyclase (GGDEF)-like protein